MIQENPRPATRKQDLPGFNAKLETEIIREFQQILALPRDAAKRATFHRMSNLTGQRRADYVKALEGLWGGCNES